VPASVSAAIASNPAPPSGFFVGLLVLWLAFVALGIVGFVFLIMAVVDIAKRPDWQWQMSGQDKVLWLILSILVAMPCALIYWFAIRPKLVGVERSAGLASPTGPVVPGWPGGFGPQSPAPPGWWPDPEGLGAERYWDGYRWTGHVRPVTRQ
jgi:hypothetical protein